MFSSKEPDLELEKQKNSHVKGGMIQKFAFNFEIYSETEEWKHLIHTWLCLTRPAGLDKDKEELPACHDNPCVESSAFVSLWILCEGGTVQVMASHLFVYHEPENCLQVYSRINRMPCGDIEVSVHRGQADVKLLCWTIRLQARNSGFVRTQEQLHVLGVDHSHHAHQALSGTRMLRLIYKGIYS